MAAASALTTSLATLPTLCATTFLPADGILNLGAGFEPLTITEPAVFHGPCPTLQARTVPHDIEPPSTDDILNDSSLSQHDTGGAPPQSNWRDPFYTSPFPLAYALAATTITAYMLVLMLFITPRSFLDGGIVYLGRRGFTNSAASGVNIGGRPWLQKVAALTVAMSLTVATADTFKAAQEQWSWGISNAKLLQMEVMGSTELKVIRLVSDTFLWLAQAQTLIRLFPRQKEKVIIKWAAFALITLDVIFSALNSFMFSADGVTSDENPKKFVHPIPALSYIFQLSLGILYAAWVIYYAVVRKRYAFYHPLMRNICLVAIISIVAILIPIVFFILDISKPDVAGWGDYVRWVGAAAASVVVWEWVERIEALEREEKKDGILGREVFDDELDYTTDRPTKRPKTSRDESSSGSGEGDVERDEEHAVGTRPGGITWAGAISNRQKQRPQRQTQRGSQQVSARLNPPARSQFWPSRPAPAVTPVSRTDTSSAASTAYTLRRWEQGRTPELVNQHQTGDLIRYDSIPRSHDIGDGNLPQPVTEDSPAIQTSQHTANGPTIAVPAARQAANIGAMETGAGSDHFLAGSTDTRERSEEGGDRNMGGWRSLTVAATPIFRPGSDAPLTEGPRNGMTRHITPRLSVSRPRNFVGRWDVTSRLEEFAANQAEKIRERIRPTTDTDNLPVMRIPAPPRAGAALQQVLEEEEMQHLQSNGRASNTGYPQPQQTASTSGETARELAPVLSSRSAPSSNSRERDAPLPPSNPPLWPGVQPRYIYDDGDDYSESSSGSVRSSADGTRARSQDGSGPASSRARAS